jgi:hypothetical protein
MEQEHYLTFGSFHLDTMHGHLWQGNHSVPLRPRTLAMLCYLAEHPGRLVTKAELREQVWAGRPEPGLQALAEALTLGGATEERWWEAEVYRLKGALLLELSNPDVHQAEACFQQALAVARDQQAKALELRAAVSLSQLWQRQDKREAARTLLAPIYGWFTEALIRPLCKRPRCCWWSCRDDCPELATALLEPPYTALNCGTISCAKRSTWAIRSEGGQAGHSTNLVKPASTYRAILSQHSWGEPIGQNCWTCSRSGMLWQKRSAMACASWELSATLQKTIAPASRSASPRP